MLRLGVFPILYKMQGQRSKGGELKETMIEGELDEVDN